ncbi:hypothetical protein NEFER03_1376 [Nematocida sp. LUAm3]|nr:hypothetical protein NEFER03_1376 [Nematocida sp. LUAm3]KAI5174794.1 hypothetical protein NEFER02_0904 [Nematocida sp. LUAm2]KAI5177795.1 hypothetical protein NEFER01_0997 [Nematocida sp. LUAm1]
MNQKIIEICKLVGEKRVVEVPAGHVIYISDVKDCQIIVRGKCAKGVILDTIHSFISIEGVISNLEVTRTKNTFVGLGYGGMLNIELCSECKFGLGTESTEVRTRRSTLSSLMHLKNISFSTATGEEIQDAIEKEKEHFLPEEIKITLSEGEIKSELVRE